MTGQDTGAESLDTASEVKASMDRAPEAAKSEAVASGERSINAAGRETLSPSGAMQETSGAEQSLNEPSLDKPYAKQRFLFICAVSCQIAVLATISASKAYTVTTGTQIAVHARVVDPRDMFRGDYLTLDFDVADVPNTDMNYGQKVYVVLQKANPYYTVERVSKEMPKLDRDHVAMRGTVSTMTKDRATVSYGLERAYIAENTGLRYASKNGFLVNLAVDQFGNAVVKSVDLAPYSPAQSGQKDKASPGH